MNRYLCKSLLTAVSLAVLCLCVCLYAHKVDASYDQAQQLKQQLSAIVKNAKTNPDTLIGVCVKVPESGRIVFSSDGNTPLVPASNLKILTTAASLNLLGPNYRLKTELRGNLPDQSGEIQGNLYLRGNGDPTTTPPYDTPCTRPYEKFIKRLKEAGVTSIAGDLVADDSAFDREYLPKGWKDSYRLDSFAAPVSSLSLNGNLIEVSVVDGQCAFNPPCTTMGVKLSDDGGAPVMERPKGSNIITVKGANNGNIRNQICVESPPLFAAGVFKSLLNQAGIKVKGQTRLIAKNGEAASVEGLHLYASHYSLPVSEIIREINHESDNLFAEHLYKVIGQISHGRGSADTGFKACQTFMASRNIDPENLYMVDGCGLSPDNRITPHQLVEVLDTMQRSYYRRWFKDSLPHSGKGTLRGRLGGIDVRAKTGTLAHDSSLTGYVITQAGQELEFSILCNNTEIWNAVNTQNQIVQTLSACTEKL